MSVESEKKSTSQTSIKYSKYLKGAIKKGVQNSYGCLLSSLTALHFYLYGQPFQCEVVSEFLDF